jgi:tRNA(adenine34) deaminase
VSNQTEIDRQFLEQALTHAREAGEIGEVPVGAVIVKDGEVIARSYNLRETHHNPLAHAEMVAIQKAAQRQEAWRLENATLYVTLEPCLMCLAALQQARIKRVVYGATDPKGGAKSLGFDFHQDPRLNHRFELEFVEHSGCGEVLSEFFRRRRREKKDQRKEMKK